MTPERRAALSSLKRILLWRMGGSKWEMAAAFSFLVYSILGVVDRNNPIAVMFQNMLPVAGFWLAIDALRDWQPLSLPGRVLGIILLVVSGWWVLGVLTEVYSMVSGQPQ